MFTKHENILSNLNLLKAQFEVDRLMIEDGLGKKRYRNIVNRSGFLTSIAFDKNIVETCNTILGLGWKPSSIQIHTLPSGFASFSWHVDYPYFTMKSWNVKDNPVSLQFIWCLDDFSSETGSLAITNCLTSTPVFDRKKMPDTYSIIDAKAGSLIMIDPRVIHSASPNPSRKVRRALLVSMVKNSIAQMEPLGC